MFSDEIIRRASLGLYGVLMLAGLAACAGAPTPLPEEQDTSLYRSRCGGCHAVPHPARHSKKQWPGMVALMERRMTEAGMPALAEGERTRILDYLERHGR